MVEERSLLRRNARQALSRRLAAVAVWAALSATAAPVTALEPAELVRQIRATRLDPGRAVELRNVELELGLARLDVERGVLVPAAIADGRTVELVFLGRARFRVSPPDAVEAGQLELFTGRPSLDAMVDEAVIVLAGEEVLRRLLDRRPGAAVGPEQLERARAIHTRWLGEPERRNTGVEGAIFKSLVGDAVFRDYFAVWCRSYEVGEFVYQLDPEDEEQLTLASFTPLDVQGWDRRRLQRRIKIQQRKGRWLGVRVDDLGAWDIWLSTSWSPRRSDPYPGNSGFEAEHYAIDLTIRRDKLRLEGVANLQLRARSSGRRVVSLELYRDLRIQRVVDGQGRELFVFRSGPEVLVQLPEPSVAGESLSLEVTYAGRALQWVGPKTHDLLSTRDWHPHCGTLDRATYDVTLRWPRKYDLVASGTRVEGGVRKHYRWERRRLEQPAIAFSFVLGDFVVERRQVGHVALSMGFNRAAPARLSEEARAEALDTVARSLVYFEETFGPYPLDRLTVVTLPRRYSQSYLGFITLTDSVLVGEGAYDSRQTDYNRETRIAHEVAHQWWGNLVGWWSYRDQWLSEATANYASLLFWADQQGEGSTFLSDMSAGWRDRLSQRTLEGRTIESLGPVVLGGRLNSSLSNAAYREIVYRKGAVVLAMLARAVGEQAFLEMLRSIADAAANRVLTTEDFLAALERMSGLDLDGFARQYVYGTGIPHVYYDYETVAAENGGWTLRGQAYLRTEPRYAFRVVRSEAYGWDVVRTARTKAGEDSTALMVPFRVTREDEQGAARSGAGRIVSGDWGRLLIRGPHESFELETPAKPLQLELDPRGETLARFYPLDVHPKRGLRRHAQDLALQGELEDAERSFLEALEREAGPVPRSEPNAWMRDAEQEARIEDCRIRLGLARLYLVQRRPDAAERELRAVEALLGSDRQIFRMERDVLRSRLDVQRGDPAAAFERLSETLRLASPRRGPRRWRDILWQLQLNSERAAVTEGYTLLAATAFETAHDEEFRWALEEARDRGVDVTLLDQVAGIPGPESPSRMID